MPVCQVERVYIILFKTRAPIFNLKIFSNFKISNSVKYGVGLSLLFAKKMQRIQLF